MNELRPCPFCGGEARIHASHHGDTHYYQVECGNEYDCGAWPTVRVHHTEAEAIAAWNSRAERMCRDVNGNPHDFTCSECGASMYTQVDECWTMIARGGRPDDVIENPSYCPNCGAKVVDE